ncbi:MAG: hypothetical protein UV57_C0044G0007 [Parcubacteria group bacterium GW2011_GWD2_43_10]|uniref:Uncharacterized protein n=5 Tax=Candidatus Vebleniibacteriota TaxID=1817921 RepID=A0A1G2Q7I0_9BACT|nr:MAG: hypothetical protein UV52_C0024G0010 [Parcubacteria group bacterium GW2011_GWD1_42_9]KKS81506.1 MAG: hypothetical protein UV57_C0044G0007 [Parcubacteria group bacterium GW2011_GWD2_43_10]KKS93296.1 MAG: hypothetical protein UV69_C0009G0013 [Parcubacteria group bacterium GW2011_GWE2_43_12]KKT12026.1 MAG: hypothetical protein UV92_C0034G0007 [Parcubacteria group bacterium GW2011_GWA1_43_27]KKT14049.1 MAG: hypothetical protein UV96_C0041G0007 [Parcubacteria group bacterium GW2011_GWF2_43_3
MEIPYTIFLGIYFLAVLFILVYALINLLHVMRLSRLSNHVVLVSFLFIAGTLFILFMSYHSLVKINWQQRIDWHSTINESFQEFNPL